ncbi:hypothetical protein FOCC_FOCC012031 [Frankliniella occidentalis]|nr:hypothetical protein FOCC_FOCC012031 [Frankliniella occidentalis]
MGRLKTLKCPLPRLVEKSHRHADTTRMHPEYVSGAPRNSVSIPMSISASTKASTTASTTANTTITLSGSLLHPPPELDSIVNAWCHDSVDFGVLDLSSRVSGGNIWY